MNDDFPELLEQKKSQLGSSKLKGFQSKLYSIFQKNFLIFKSFNLSKEKRDAKVVSYKEYAQLELSHAFSFAKFASVVMEKNLFYIISG